ncbi:hypothetical protein A0H81_00857 [Grifola frondosa]|uniref:Uncharacterized protein n=1 Tax=Grifola frondosa TaxID=5627 RepID=A0A1C7MQ31_GRIFR|nr:hypothetical protein A0H81_00857 [Grifola frondosa]
MSTGTATITQTLEILAFHQHHSLILTYICCVLHWNSSTLRMLLRNAGHGIASAITLEFLAPSLIRSKFVTRTVATTPARPRPRGDRKPSIAPSTPPSPRRSPSALLRKLDEQLQVFHGRSGPSDSQAEIFNRATPELRTALREKDIRRAWSIWLSLEKEKLLAFFGPSHYEMYSTTVAAIFSGTPADHQWDEIETQALQNIAVFTAAGGATDGLLACMTLYIKRRDPETVVRLYDRYFSLLEKKVAWKGVECVADTRQDEVELDLGPTEQDALATSVRGDILLAAVTAHAMRGSFSDALLTCLPTAIRLTPNNLWDFMTRLEHDPALRERVQDYGQRGYIPGEAIHFYNRGCCRIRAMAGFQGFRPQHTEASAITRLRLGVVPDQFSSLPAEGPRSETLGRHDQI